MEKYIADTFFEKNEIENFKVVCDDTQLTPEQLQTVNEYFDKLKVQLGFIVDSKSTVFGNQFGEEDVIPFTNSVLIDHDKSSIVNSVHGCEWDYHTNDVIDTETMSGPEFLEYVGCDAAKWAKELNKRSYRFGYGIIDEGWLIAWFANAITAGEMFGRKAERDKQQEGCVSTDMHCAQQEYNS